MDQIKVGKFIARRRKVKNLTQAQLAEKLGITDRAVSKWENGKGMPDSSLMLELCSELDISVNELLCGEEIEMTDYNRKAEERLLEMARKEEMQNKRLINAMWLVVVADILFLVSTEIFAALYLGESLAFGIVTAIAIAVFLLIGFISMRLEAAAGYYECKHCHHKFAPTYKQVVRAPHMGTTRYFKCPECGKRGWYKKVMK